MLGEPIDDCRTSVPPLTFVTPVYVLPAPERVSLPDPTLVIAVPAPPLMIDPLKTVSVFRAPSKNIHRGGTACTKSSRTRQRSELDGGRCGSESIARQKRVGGHIPGLKLTPRRSAALNIEPRRVASGAIADRDGPAEAAQIPGEKVLRGAGAGRCESRRAGDLHRNRMVSAHYQRRRSSAEVEHGGTVGSGQDVTLRPQHETVDVDGGAARESDRARRPAEVRGDGAGAGVIVGLKRAGRGRVTPKRTLVASRVPVPPVAAEVAPSASQYSRVFTASARGVSARPEARVKMEAERMKRDFMEGSSGGRTWLCWRVGSGVGGLSAAGEPVAWGRCHRTSFVAIPRKRGKGRSPGVLRRGQIDFGPPPAGCDRHG